MFRRHAIFRCLRSIFDSATSAQDLRCHADAALRRLLFMLIFITLMLYFAADAFVATDYFAPSFIRDKDMMMLPRRHIIFHDVDATLPICFHFRHAFGHCRRRAIDIITYAMLALMPKAVAIFTIFY